MYNKAIIVLISFFLFFSKPFFNAHAEDARRFRFVVMGCMYFGLCPPQDYELAVERIKQYNPDFVLFLGGMVHDIGRKPVKSLWEEFDRITEKLGVPVYDIPSDTRDISKLRGILIPIDRNALMEKCFLDRYKKRYYAFEHKNNLFICLDSRKKLSTDEDQLDFLKKTIADVSKYDNVFIALHYSPRFIDNNKSEWFEVIYPLIKGKIQYVFGAQKHVFDLRKIDDITYITSGSPPCLESKAKLSFFHFLIVDVDKKEVSIKIVPIEPIPAGQLESYDEMTTEVFKFLTQKSLPSWVKVSELTASEREVILQPARIIKTLNIKPGMSILDIGAGTGFFTFHFAEALKGTGKVFASETDPKMIGYIKEKMKEGKYKNIFPVLVKSEGLDPFYKQHSYDIMFLSEIYQYLWHPEDYFRELRPLLEKTGRLYILHFKNVSDFSEIEFDDFKKVIEILISKGEDFPVFKRLKKEVQYFIKNWQYNNDVPLEIRMKIIQDFNKMLSDRLFFNDLLAYYIPEEGTEYEWGRPLETILYQRDFELAKWLIVHLDESGVFDEEEKTLNDIDRKRLCELNRILLTGIFESYKLLKLKGVFPIYVEKDKIISKLKAASFRFVREHNFLPHHYFLEFKREF